MTRRSIALVACLAVGAALFGSLATAQTLYKLTDKNGKVTYSEKAPKDFDGTVVPLNIDPKANTATLPKPSAKPAPAAPRASPSSASASSTDKVQVARDKLESAKKALQDAIDNPREDEIQRVGNKGGFTRPVPTEEYQKRLEALKDNVRKAEEELKVAEGR
jgi:hypothetical protein